jgi:hypothetical protein
VKAAASIGPEFRFMAFSACFDSCFRGLSTIAPWPQPTSSPDRGRVFFCSLLSPAAPRPSGPRTLVQQGTSWQGLVCASFTTRSPSTPSSDCRSSTTAHPPAGGLALRPSSAFCHTLSSAGGLG